MKAWRLEYIAALLRCFPLLTASKQCPAFTANIVIYNKQFKVTVIAQIKWPPISNRHVSHQGSANNLPISSKIDLKPKLHALLFYYRANSVYPFNSKRISLLQLPLQSSGPPHQQWAVDALCWCHLWSIKLEWLVFHLTSSHALMSTQVE